VVLPQTVRAVIDTSSLVPFHLRRDLQQAAQLGRFEPIWSPWIVAELNCVLVWRWIEWKGSTSSATERDCSASAKQMMDYMIPFFTTVDPKPPYPPPWAGLRDTWDRPIWAAAKVGGARYVVSENTKHFPPLQPDGHHVYEGIEYVRAATFIALLTGTLERDT